MNESLGEQDTGQNHPPKRSVSKYVSEAFSFLNTEEYSDEEGVPPAERRISKREPNKNNDKSLHNGDTGHKVSTDQFTIVTTVEPASPPKKCSINSGEEIYAKVIVTDPEISEKSDEPFTIVTYVNQDEPEFSTSKSKVIQINPVYEVEEIEPDSADVTKFADNESKEIKGAADKPDESTQRNSVVIDGQEVELRQSPTDRKSPRKSRQSSWQKNQKAVSEAFDFLQEFGELKSVEEENGKVAVITSKENNEDEKGDSFQTNSEVEHKDVKDTSGEISNSVDDLTVKVPQVALLKQVDSEASISGGSETDEVGELRGKITRRRNKGAVNKSPENGDDEGDSSDEDTGVYRESFRKSTWLYIGDNSDVKRGVNQSDYVPLADLGLATCDDDSIFGEGPPATPTLLPVTPTGGHARNDSISTTVSENEFRNKQRNQFNSVSKRFVQRADSQQEYRRYTAKFYDQVKYLVVERNSSTDYGIHVLDSKPAIISAVDSGSPAERSGVKEGFVLISVNGVNVLDAEHRDIIELVQDNPTTLTLEVGFGDLSPVVDLQVPVLTGYMLKQSSATLFKTWKKRYFILRRDSCLYYYKTEHETDPLGAIPLGGYAVSRYGDFNKFGFKAEKYDSKTYYFQAESRDDMTEWVGCLTEASTRGKHKKDTWMDVTTHNVGLPALQIRKPDCSGYLYKLGRATRRWRKRYCVLKDACVYYYKSSNSKSAEGVVHLHGYNINQSEVLGKKHSFCLHPPESQMRVFSFYTDNDTDRVRWLTALESSIGKWVKVE